MKNPFLHILFILLASAKIFAQDEPAKWDNWFVMGNKIVFGGEDKFKHSHEVQWRANNNIKSLERIFYEGVLTYSSNKNWEFSPDLRISFTPNGTEFRPGLGAIYKDYLGKGENKYRRQMVHQLKFQTDIRNVTKPGLRYVLTYNHLLSEKFIISGLAGAFYRWSNDFTGIQFVRVGYALSYIFDEVHSVGFVHAIGFENRGKEIGWTYSNFPMLQLIIRVNKDYKYVPAKYINF